MYVLIIFPTRDSHPRGPGILVPAMTETQLPARIRSFNARRGRVSPQRDGTFQRLWPAFGVPVSEEPLDLAATFGRRAPLVLEIGSGMGEASAAMAAADPDRDYLAVE